MMKCRHPCGAHAVQTTIMAATFHGGVVLGADFRTSTGSYVANRVKNKLTQLAEKVHPFPRHQCVDSSARSRLGCLRTCLFPVCHIVIPV